MSNTQIGSMICETAIVGVPQERVQCVGLASPTLTLILDQQFLINM